MQKVYISLFIVLLFSCCTSSSSKEEELEYPVVIQNKALIEAIANYQDFLYTDNKKDIERGDSIYVGICSKDINDSIYRYVIYPVYRMSLIQFYAPLSLCKVNGHHVLFSHTNAYMIWNEERKFSRFSDDAYQKCAEVLFPKEYEESKKKHNINCIKIYEPENCYLTFLGDSLIDKTFKRGSIRDKIPVKLNGEEVYL